MSGAVHVLDYRRWRLEIGNWELGIGNWYRQEYKVRGLINDNSERAAGDALSQFLLSLHPLDRQPHRGGQFLLLRYGLAGSHLPQLLLYLMFLLGHL